MFIGKNTFAISVLRRIEMKLDGRDLSENRYLLSFTLLKLLRGLFFELDPFYECIPEN